MFSSLQLKAKLEVSSFPSEQRNHEAEFLELNRVGLPIREVCIFLFPSIPLSWFINLCFAFKAAAKFCSFIREQGSVSITCVMVHADMERNVVLTIQSKFLMFNATLQQDGMILTCNLHHTQRSYLNIKLWMTYRLDLRFFLQTYFGCFYLPRMCPLVQKKRKSG
jgi:hypothetical protein